METNPQKTSESPPAAKIKKTEAAPAESLNPYFIESMKQREYPGSEIKIEETVGSFGKFTSYVVSYLSDGLKIFALMNVPKNNKPAQGFPVVIVNHGFIEPSSYSTTASYKKISDFYANNGFLVLKPDYRGHAKSQGEAGSLNRILYAVDVLNLISSVWGIQQANPEKIFMYGHSMGGDVTLRVLEVTEKVQAATLWAPVSAPYPENLLYFVRRHRPEMVQQIQTAIETTFAKEDLVRASPIENTKFLKTPLIIHHGTSDESVPYSWSIDLNKKLNEAKKTHTFYTYNGEDHNFTRGSWSTASSQDIQFFASY